MCSSITSTRPSAAVAVQAAHDAAQPPLFVRVVLDRGVDVLDAGVEHDEEIDAGDERDPDEMEAERTQVPQRIAAGAEERIEDGFDTLQRARPPWRREFFALTLGNPESGY
jgi:hypothetical protein